MLLALIPATEKKMTSYHTAEIVKTLMAMVVSISARKTDTADHRLFLIKALKGADLAPHSIFCIEKILLEAADHAITKLLLHLYGSTTVSTVVPEKSPGPDNSERELGLNDPSMLHNIVIARQVADYNLGTIIIIIIK